MKEQASLPETQGRVILYTAADGKVVADVFFGNETFWLTQRTMAELFGVNIPAISKHLKNIYASGELNQEATISKMEIVQKEGVRQIAREVEVYNLDSVIAVAKANEEYEKYRVQQNHEYLSDFDRVLAKYLKGSNEL